MWCVYVLVCCVRACVRACVRVCVCVCVCLALSLCVRSVLQSFQEQKQHINRNAHKCYLLVLIFKELHKQIVRYIVKPAFCCLFLRTNVYMYVLVFAPYH